jgi:hypothetical protein
MTALPEPSEAVILAKVHQALAATGRVVCWRNNTGALPAVGRGGRVFPVRYGLGVGGADLVGLLRGGIRAGRFVGFEVKTANGKQTNEQMAWAEAVRKAGGYYALVRSAEDALSALTEAER